MIAALAGVSLGLLVLAIIVLASVALQEARNADRIINPAIRGYCSQCGAGSCPGACRW